MKVDVLAFGAHPDDVEISAGGTVAAFVAQGKKVGIVDLTRGELGTRGSADLRDQESAAAAKILGLSIRENLALPDGFFQHSKENIRAVIIELRRFQPDIVLCNSITDRHPDHGKGSRLVAEACFLSGLKKVETTWNGQSQDAWRPKAVYHYIQDFHIEPDVVMDISDHFDAKMASIKAYGSQFFDPESKEANTPISGEEFFDQVKGRALQMGRPAGFLYGEGFTSERYIGVTSLFDLR
jgi:N-acetylglucosamine malate deacetylase 1